MSIASKAAAWAATKVGCPYNQSKRMQINPDIYDCSSLTARAYAACGCKWTVGSMPAKAAASNVLVTDPGFALLWPGSQGAIGQTRTGVAALKDMGWTPTEGDVLYICTDATTTRRNKITHVVIVLDGDKIVHARGTAYGVRVDALTLYDGKIVALSRYKEPGADLTPVKAGGSAGGTVSGGKTGTVTGGSVNVRKVAGTQGVILTTVHKGDVLEVTGAEAGGWWPVVVPGKGAGWVSGKYLSVGG